MKLILVPGSSDRERAARARKAEALVEVLLQAEAIPAQVALMSDEQWLMASQAAGVRPPSSTTRALVLEMTKENAAVRVSKIAGPSCIDCGEPSEQPVCPQCIEERR